MYGRVVLALSVLKNMRPGRFRAVFAGAVLVHPLTHWPRGYDLEQRTEVRII